LYSGEDSSSSRRRRRKEGGKEQIPFSPSLLHGSIMTEHNQ